MKSIFETNFQPLPDEVTYDHVYEILGKFIPENRTKRNDVLFIFCCGVVAALASYYNYSFSKIYVHDIAKRWGFTEEDAGLFGELCGIVGLVINTSINAKSISHAYDVIKNEILTKIKGTGKPMPDDRLVRIMTGIMALLSMIGAIPNLKFVYDTTKDNIPYLIFMEIIQFITSTALSLRGLYTTFNLSTEKKEEGKKYKRALLTILRGGLINKEQVTPNDIVDLSDGKVVRTRFFYARKAISIGIAFGVGGYSAAFFSAAVSALSGTSIGKPIDDIVSFAETGCGLLSASLKWFFLGNASSKFVDKLFSLSDQPILKTGEKEVRPGIVSRRVEIVLTLIGFLVAIFSLGSSSKIVEKYFFQNVEKTSETFWLSLLIGGGAALGINAGDAGTVLTELINFGARIFNSKRANYSPADRFGNSHDEMVMTLMYRIAKMPETTFLQEFTQEYIKDDLKMEAMEQGLPEEDNLMDKPGLHMIGRYYNENFHLIREACKKFHTIRDDSAFASFKEKYIPLDDTNAKEIDDHRPLLSNTNNSIQNA